MKEVAKYNLFKTMSLILTIGAPLITAITYSDFIVYDSSASISMAGVIAILFSALFLKDKIAENLKLPSPFVAATVLFITIQVIKSIIIPMETICGVTMLICGIDQLTFRRIYKRIELLLPEKVKAYKHFGFIFCKTDELKGETE